MKKTYHSAEVTAADQALLDEAELQEMEQWVAWVRKGWVPREARIPENYLRRIDRLVAIARRKTIDIVGES